MLNEVVYCPRLFFYEWVEGVFAHSHDTVEGELRHEKLETKADAMPPPESAASIHSRSVELASDAYGIIAKMDLVEGEGGVVTPIDYKKGWPRDGDDGPEGWPPEVAQVVAQCLILRDAGYRCEGGVLYYHGTRQRVPVVLTDALIADTLQSITQARSLAAGGRIPPPLVDSPKCPRCSLVGICLPDETNLCESLPAIEDNAQLSLFEETPPAVTAAAIDIDDALRRLVPARDDLRPLYITGYDLSVGKTGEVLTVKSRDKKKIQDVRIGEISQVNLFGTPQISTQAVQGLCAAEKPIAYFSTGGWFYGLTQGLGLKNVFLRREQFRRADEEFFCSLVARNFVASKIRNQRTLLQRNHVDPPKITLRRLDEAAERALGCTELESLLGIEGTAARLYFEAFAGMIKVEDVWGGPSFDFEGRNRRPPRDPVNALLSFGYSLLAKDLTIVCHQLGLDPFIGFFHQPRFGRPALALDLMESFRPLIADSTVITAINTRMVQPKHFIRVGPAVSMLPAGRKAFLRAYEQRMDTLVTHPLFGYRVSYRRVLEVQARLFSRVLSGELARYPGFETR